MGVPMRLLDISLAIYSYLLTKTIEFGLLVVLTGLTVYITFQLYVLHKKRTLRTPILTFIVSLTILLMVIILTFSKGVELSTDIKEVWLDDTKTEVLEIHSISDTNLIMKDTIITTDRQVLINVRNEWYLKEGKKYEITYYKTSKVISSVKKVEGETY